MFMFCPIEVKFKQLDPRAKLPAKANEKRNDPLTGDSGYDIFSIEAKVIPVRGSAVFDTGVQVAYITPGFWYRIEAKSGLGFHHDLQPHFGVFDQPYRGIQTIKLYNLGDKDYTVKAGDKIAQMVFYPLITANVSWTDKIEETDRGGGRLGSTGR